MVLESWDSTCQPNKKISLISDVIEYDPHLTNPKGLAQLLSTE